MLLQGITHCWAVIDHHHRVSLKRTGRKEGGGRGRAGQVWGGRRESKGRGRGSHKLQLQLASFSPSWTPLTFRSGASWSPERFNWMDSSDVFGLWVMKKGGGGREGWRPWWRERRGGGTCHDLQRLIAWLFLGPYWSLTGAGPPRSGLAKALRALPEPRLRKCSPSSRSRATCGPINSRPARVAAAPPAPPGQSSIHRLCSSCSPNSPH